MRESQGIPELCLAVSGTALPSPESPGQLGAKGFVTYATPPPVLCLQNLKFGFEILITLLPQVGDECISAQMSHTPSYDGIITCFGAGGCTYHALTTTAFLGYIDPFFFPLCQRAISAFSALLSHIRWAGHRQLVTPHRCPHSPLPLGGVP